MFEDPAIFLHALPEPLLEFGIDFALGDVLFDCLADHIGDRRSVGPRDGSKFSCELLIEAESRDLGWHALETPNRFWTRRTS